MRCEKIMSILKEQVPESFAEEWDNVGLLAGDPGKDVRKILVALDASDGVIDQAEALGADMLITHHPLIFSPVKKITADDFIGRRICRLIREILPIMPCIPIMIWSGWRTKRQNVWI